MPTFNYSLERGQPKRLKIVWNFSNPPELSVRLNGTEIANISATVPELTLGHQIDLPDNSVLNIQLVKGSLCVSKNNIPLLNSPGDPHRKIRNAYISAFLLGGLSIYIGILSTFFFHIPEILTIILGAVLIILGFLIKRESFWPLVIAVIVQLLFNAIPNLLNIKAIFAGGLFSIFSFALRSYLLYQMIMGIGAWRSIKKLNRKAVSGK